MTSRRQQLKREIERINPVSLGTFPTPLHPIPRYGRSIGHDELYIKRDDMSGFGLGGNKVRALEFMLADLGDATSIIVGGGLQSNLCSIAAMAAASRDLDCLIVHNSDHPGRLEGNMLLNAMAGSREVFLGPVDEKTRSVAMEDLAVELRHRGERPYVFDEEVVAHRSALGYVVACLEFVEQCDRCGLDIEHLAIPGAMAGTASGLVAGAAILGVDFHVHVINVEYPGDTLAELVGSYTSWVFDTLGMDPIHPVSRVMTVHHHSLGEGYSRPTEESLRAQVDLARTQGILTELVYTSKTLAGLARLIRDRAVAPGEGACFWHTGGIGALFAQGDTIADWL